MNTMDFLACPARLLTGVFGRARLRQRRPPRFSWSLLVVAVSVVAGAASVAPALLGRAAFEAHAQSASPPARPCALDDAEGRYVNGAFEEAARLATRCLEQGDPTQAQQVRAHRFLILARLQQGNQQAARTATVALLSDAPGYTPDSVQDPPSYITFVNDVREEMQAAGRLPPGAPSQEQGSWIEGRRRWLAIGGGLLVTGLIAIFAGD